MVISAAVFFSAPNAKAANSITILIDGNIFQPPDAQPYIASDRVMVPFRPIAEAMGASATWDEADQKVSIALGGKYVEFIIGSNTMSVVTTDANGGVANTNVTLDAPATLVNNNRAFVPIRALTEGLGATVQWVAESSTVMITSNIVRATPTPVPTPTPAINSAFATSASFEIISGTRAQFMYDNYNHEVLYYFNSSDPNAVSSLSAVLQAAQTVNDKVWGVDVNTSQNFGNLNWIYNYVDRTTQGPALFFLYNVNQTAQVIPVTAFNDQNLLNTAFQNWNRNYFTTPSLTPTPTPSISVTPTGSPTPTFGAPFIPISKSDAMDKFDYGDHFILLYYNSSQSNFSQSKLTIMMNAVYNAGDDVYYFDDSQYLGYSWFGGDNFNFSYLGSASDYDAYSRNIPNPCLFYIDSSTVINTDFDSNSYMGISNNIETFMEGY